MVLPLLFQFSNTTDLFTCWIGSVGAEGDSGCDVDAASEHSSDTAGRRGARCKAIDGDKECVGRNQATPRTPAPALLQPTTVTWTRILDQNRSAEASAPISLPRKGGVSRDSSLSYLLTFSACRVISCPVAAEIAVSKAGGRATPCNQC